MKSFLIFSISLFAAKALGAIPQNNGCFTNLTSATGGVSCSDCLAGCSATTALCAPACARGWKVDGCSVPSKMIFRLSGTIDKSLRRVLPVVVRRTATSASQNANYQMSLVPTVQRRIQRAKCTHIISLEHTVYIPLTLCLGAWGCSASLAFVLKEAQQTILTMAVSDSHIAVLSVL